MFEPKLKLACVTISIPIEAVLLALGSNAGVQLTVNKLAQPHLPRIKQDIYDLL